MRVGRAKRQLALGLALGLWGFAIASPASAYHSKQNPLITDNAYLLPQQSIQVGLWRVDLAAHRAITLGTYHFAWLLGLANLSVKWHLFHDENWAGAARVSVFRLDLGKLAKLGSDSKAVFWALPFELPVTRAFGERYDLSASLIYTYLAVTGNYAPTEFDGVAAASNLQLTATFDARLTRTFAMFLQARTLLFQTLSASGSSTLRLDDYTTAEIALSGQTNALDVKNGSSILLGGVLSFARFNVRFGVGYGHWSLPAINLVLPDKRVFYDIDMYMRF